MGFIVLLPFFASCGFILRKSYREAFLYVYLPVLICLPTWSRWVLPGLPDPTFQQAAVLPIAAVGLFKSRYRFSRLDLFVFAFLLICGLSEYVNAGYSEAQNLMFDMLSSGLLPYLLAKDLMADTSFQLKAIKIFVLCSAGVIVAALYEAKFGTNPFRLFLDPFFPGQGDVWVTTFRYGLARASGPYGHAILAGIMFMIALRLQCWLQVCGHWKSNLAATRLGPFRLAKLLTFWNFLGLCVTWVRGPQGGALLAWLIFRVSRTKRPRVSFRRALIALSVGIIPMSIWFYSYISVGRASAVTAGQESAAYRKELMEKYTIIVIHHAWLGWGRNGWPKVSGMPSIDNYYLLIGLMHGIPAAALLMSILILISVRLFKNGLATLAEPSTRSSLSFTLLSIYLGLIFSLATAYMGENVFGVFFVLLGLTEAFLRQGRLTVSLPVRRVRTTMRAKPTARFRRVLA